MSIFGLAKKEEVDKPVEEEKPPDKRLERIKELEEESAKCSDGIRMCDDELQRLIQSKGEATKVQAQEIERLLISNPDKSV